MRDFVKNVLSIGASDGDVRDCIELFLCERRSCDSKSGCGSDGHGGD
jgi:hypothetical protein